MKTQRPRLSTLARLAAGMAMLLLCTAVLAQAYPTRSVRLVVASPPGGVTDILARALAQGLGTTWSQPVVVENRPGAGQIIGSDIVAKSSPDGYSLLVSDSSTFAISPHLYSKLPYDPFRDFTPISALCAISPALGVSATVPANTIRELIALAKAKPGTLTYGSVGSGSYMHIAMENFKQLTGTDLVHVPYKGAAPAISGLLTGELSMLMVSVSSLDQQVKAGKVKLLAVATPKRVPSRPELPTIAESGVPGFETGSWWAVFGPGGMPAELVARIYESITKLTTTPEFRQQYMARFSFEPLEMTPQQLTEYVKRDYERWGPLVKASGAKVD
ncbi:MAG: tripartite tricarboxylate transporter substrate binding protein [Betaproteobacteria bacterium]|nr:tripartite tricarboxylate transporter substrate binding protein [Betaproteobacteria bacterium]